MAETDRELLELAAKAAGYESHGYGELVGGDPCLLLKEADFTGMWAPLTDDGDEARLEAALGLNVRWRVHHVEVGHALEDTWQESYALHGGDKQAARRYAGVRAAAEIGRAKESSE